MKSCLRLSVISLFFLAAARAAGPEEIAIPTQSLWPEAIHDRASYDAASRAEILLFLKAYGEDAEGTIPGGNEDSLRAWRERSSRFFLAAYRDAAKDCSGTSGLGCAFTGTSFPELLGFAAAFPARLSPRFNAWLTMSEKFDHTYLAEQKRLAALFPKPTSEILPVADSEVFGDRFRDGEFLLSFDDGPTPVGGNTDLTVALLEKNGLTAQFFALGDMLQPRIGASSLAAVEKLYERQCLGSHGFEHKSHQTWDGWKASLDNTWKLIQQINPGSSVRFRPPFGQRNAEVVAEQQRLAGAPIVLWNIDSQDWNDKMPIDKVGDRVQKLMLIWRKGIILMHDIHPKAQVAVPQLARFAASAGLSWVDCRSIR